ncbi:MAG: EamA family transporter [Acidimicrobiia bacterium]|nr:EamA family transporter [Acidimicrobiia bacterium]
MTGLAALLFGVNGSVAADLLGSIPPTNAAQIRSILAALILGALAYRRRATRHGGRLLPLAALGVILATVTVSFFAAISRLGVGPGVTIQFTGPVLVLAWMRWVGKQPVPRVAWWAAAAALGGVGLISRAWEVDQLDLVGLGAALLASVTFAAYLILSGHLGRVLPAVSVTAYGFAFSALALLLVVPVRLPSPEPVILSELAWLVIMGTVVPFSLEVAALRRVDAGTVGVVATLEPVVGAAVAWGWLGQVLDGWQVAGGLIVVAAVAIVQRFKGGEPTPIA